ncbi:hypothetical protein VTL71DRAFT_2177 [Oculimacula yallundae]|uniref:Uncharacterized protein n=1 Tax=Oculimacula yallundae TaxID=86028 RepID=A0ABR4CA25_9HELO
MSVVMKTFFIALLALPAILASPTPADTTPAAALPVLANDFMCTCINDAGNKRAGSCMYFGQQDIAGEWCQPRRKSELGMDKKFTNEFCAYYGNYKPECRPIKLCQSSLIPNPDYYMQLPDNMEITSTTSCFTPINGSGWKCWRRHLTDLFRPLLGARSREDVSSLTCQLSDHSEGNHLLSEVTRDDPTPSPVSPTHLLDESHGLPIPEATVEELTPVPTSQTHRDWQMYNEWVKGGLDDGLQGLEETFSPYLPISNEILSFCSRFLAILRCGRASHLP